MGRKLQPLRGLSKTRSSGSLPDIGVGARVELEVRHVAADAGYRPAVPIAAADGKQPRFGGQRNGNDDEIDALGSGIQQFFFFFCYC